MDKSYIVNADQAGQRFDKTFAKIRLDYSRSMIEKLIKSGNILVNNTPASAKYKLKLGDKIILNEPHLKTDETERVIPVIYEDDSVIVIDKPIGVLSHSKGKFNDEFTIAGFINPRLLKGESWIDNNRAGIVHRLDRATSGVMICAKNLKASKMLQKQFSNRNVKKTYTAVVSGKIEQSNGLIDMPIERNPKKPSTFKVGPKGKSAQTYFELIDSNDKLSMLDLKPVTGRTHQLRVHLKQIGNPIVGDFFYDGLVADRLMLHATSLEITLPGGIRKIFKSELPVEFKELLQ